MLKINLNSIWLMIGVSNKNYRWEWGESSAQVMMDHKANPFQI